jgi:hypothetical protein
MSTAYKRTCQQISVIVFLFFIFASGCERSKPTTIATLNLSGRELVGNFFVQRETAPFVSNSLHTGELTLKGGETATVDLVDLWTEETFQLQGVVPERTRNENSNTLLMTITKDLSLSLSWKSKKQSLTEIQIDNFLNNFKCIPIIIHNQGPRADFVVRLIQEKYVHVCDRQYIEPTSHFINYGFLHLAQPKSDCILAISYGPGVFTETRFAEIPMDFINSSTTPLTAYLQVNQSSETALLYLLKNANPDPRITAENTEWGKNLLHEPSIKISLKRTTDHVTRRNFCLPDLNSLKSSGPKN